MLSLLAFQGNWLASMWNKLLDWWIAGLIHLGSSYGLKGDIEKNNGKNPVHFAALPKC